uniref:Uncharacterized protein n=1 Tax=Rhizophora mucronata TaxID=61149 RepID=A0A2P2QGV7_RHIMU
MLCNEISFKQIPIHVNWKMKLNRAIVKLDKYIMSLYDQKNLTSHPRLHQPATPMSRLMMPYKLLK